MTYFIDISQLFGAWRFYFNEFLYDDLDSERELGIKYGHYLMEKCDVVFSYEMHGVSRGMNKDLEIAKKLGLEIKHLTKYPWDV